MERTLSGTTTLSQSGPGSDGNEWVLCIPKPPELLKPHHQIVYCRIQDTRWADVLPLSREAVGLFYSPTGRGQISLAFKKHFRVILPISAKL